MVNSLIDITLERIGQEYQAGTLPWMKANKPNEWSTMLTLEGRVNEMALGSDLSGLRDVLDEYQRIILAMVKEFTLKEQGSFKFVERPQSPGEG